MHHRSSYSGALVACGSLDGIGFCQSDYRLPCYQNHSLVDPRQATAQVIMSNLIAIVHHLFVFGLISTIFGVYTVLKVGAWQQQKRFTKILNRWTVALTLGALLAGFSRALWFEKPFTHYANHPFFWIKIASVLTILFLSLLIERKINGNIQENTQRQIYRLTFIQMHVFPLAVIGAVLMARGF